MPLKFESRGRRTRPAGGATDLPSSQTPSDNNGAPAQGQHLYSPVQSIVTIREYAANTTVRCRYFEMGVGGINAGTLDVEFWNQVRLSIVATHSSGRAMPSL